MTAHVYYLEDAKKLVAAGVNILAHSVRDKELDADTIPFDLQPTKNLSVCLDSM